MGEAINSFFFFGLIGFEYAVPDYKGGPIIFVDILLLRAVVHPVVGRSCKNIFEERMHLADVLGVYPKLKQDCNLIGYKNDHGVKTYQGNGKDKYDLDVLHPT